MPDTSTPINDPKFLFETLNQKLVGKPDALQKIAAHVAATTDYPDHEALYELCTDTELKVRVLKECLMAALNQEWNKLKGSVPKGQAAATPQEAPAKSRDQLADKMSKGLKKSEPDSNAGTPQSQVPLPPQVAQALGAFMQTLQGMGMNGAGNSDPKEVTALVNDIMKTKMAEFEKDLKGFTQRMEDVIHKTIAMAVNNIPPKDVLEIRKWDGNVKQISGLRHKQLPQIARFVTARTSGGFPVTTWLYGAPGAGKTHLGKQLAEICGVQYYPIPLGPTSTEGKLVGYNNLASGQFVEGLIYRPFKDGGFCLLDEIDVADPSVLVSMNALIANDSYRFPNGDLVPRHKDFYLLASANTLGTGAANGFTRNKLDAATLDRFPKMKLHYDRDLENKLCGNPKWADYVWKCREYVEKNCNKSIYITPRASINGAALLANGVEAQEVVEACLFAQCGEDTKQTIIKNCGVFKP